MWSSTAIAQVRLCITLSVAAIIVAVSEWASHCVLAERFTKSAKVDRQSNVVILPKDPANLPPVKEPLVLVLGNSHTYALPGLAAGDPLRSGVSKVMVDELAAYVGARYPEVEAQFDLLAYPNFLPYEMLTRAGQLLTDGYRPKIVIVGITWRNIARDSQLRHEIRSVYRDAEFAHKFGQKLSYADGSPSPDVAAAIAREVRRVQRDLEVERLRSAADRTDENLTRWFGEHLVLLGRSAELRSRLYRAVAQRVQGALIDETRGKFSYDLIEGDYHFNVSCLNTLVKMLQKSGAVVVCYWAPERSDLPPLMDPQLQQQFMADLQAFAFDERLLVLDARRTVPDEYWGWEGNAPDRSHFTEPGHQLLAAFLFDSLESNHVWARLEQ